MNFSLSLLRLPIGRPFGLPDWPGCYCGADGLGRAMAVYPELSLRPAIWNIVLDTRTKHECQRGGWVCEKGRQPRSLNVKLLLRGIPLAWSNQHAAFGFSY